jgi:S1-C subfamily serine protease
VASFPGEFDDPPEEESSGPLLPKEDRLWRHPSEIGDGLPAVDPLVIQNRWLEREPTRANAWTAGLVGALLATGIVFVGTHLAMGGPNAAAVQRAATASSPNGAAPATTLAPEVPRMIGVGATLTTAIGSVGRAVGLVEVAGPRGDEQVLGVVIGSDGMVLTAAAPLSNATSVLVQLPGEPIPLVGEVVGSDKLSGLAVIHVNGVHGLATATLAESSPSAAAMVIAVTAPNGSTYAAGVVREDDVTGNPADAELVDSSMTDLSASYTPLGSPVVNDDGEVVGLVTGVSSGGVVFAPSWLANPVATELQSFGSVRRGWLGIDGSTEPAKSAQTPAGVLVKTVAPHSAAAKAGIRPGDLIVELNGAPIPSMATLAGKLYVLRPGTAVLLSVIHDGVARDTRVPLGSAAGS